MRQKIDEDQNQTPSPADLAANAPGVANMEKGDSQEQKGGEYTPPASQEELDKIVESRLARERQKFSNYDELKSKAAKFDEAEREKMTQAERDAQRIQELEAEMSTLRLNEKAAEIAREFDIEPALLRGSSEEELRSHAELLSKSLSAYRPAGAKVPGEGAQSNQVNSPGGDWLREQFTRR